MKTLFYCYKCGAVAEPFGRSCRCGVGRHSGKPNAVFVSSLPTGWHAHTLVQPKKENAVKP